MESRDSSQSHASAALAQPNNLLVAPLLPLIAAQAAEADATRSVSSAVIAALKSNDVMRMSAVRALGGLESSITAMGRELEAVAAACGSTGWCLWNHLCVFHFYCGLLGPAHIELLRSITANRHWVCLRRHVWLRRPLCRLHRNHLPLRGRAPAPSGFGAHRS